MDKRRTAYINISKKIISLVLFCCFLLLGVQSGYAQDGKSRTVRVGYVISLYNMEGEEGEPKSGYSYESYRKLAQYANWELEYVYGSWGDIFRKLNSGEVDLMADVSYVEERTSYLFYPKTPQAMAKFCVVTLADNPDIFRLADLAGKRVGVVDKTAPHIFFAEYAPQHNLGCTIAPYEDDRAPLEKLYAKEVDAVFMTTESWSKDRSYQLRRVGDYLKDDPIYFAVSKKNPQVFAELEKAMHDILKAYPNYFQNTYDAYTKEVIESELSAEQIQLSEKATEWLATHKTIRVGYLDGYEPYSYTNTNGDFAGTYRDMLDKICAAQKIGLEAIRYDNVQSLLKALQEGNIDVCVPITANQYFAEKNNIILAQTQLVENLYVFNRGNYDRAKAKVAVDKNDLVMLPYIQSVFDAKNIVLLDSENDCFAAVRNGRADCTYIGESYYMSDLLEHPVRYENLRSARDRVQTMTMCFAVEQSNLGLENILRYYANEMDATRIQQSLIEHSHREREFSFIDFIQRNPLLALAAMLLLAALAQIFAQQRKIQDQLRATAEAEKVAADAERKANESKTRFLSSMSHDIRTPMNAIVNYTDRLLKEKELSLGAEDSLKKIKVSSDHLLTLINDVLDISRVESGKIAIASEAFDAQKLIDEVKEILEPRCEDYSVQMDVHTDLKERYLHGDALRIRQLYLNIIANAIKYNVADGHVDVNVSQTMAQEGRAVRMNFICADTGIGMSEDFQKVMYESFARETDTRVNEIQGTGLGLAICKELVEMMGGSIECRSKVGVGTTFTIVLELPVASEEEVAAAQPTTTRTTEEWGKILGSLRVLVAEDNKINWNILKLILLDVGIEAERVTNGKQCVEKLLTVEENDYDLVLMDVRMPVMDGREATRNIRAAGVPWLQQLPVIALSADAFADDVAESKAAGMTEHITKPVDAATLYRTMYAVVQERKNKE